MKNFVLPLALLSLLLDSADVGAQVPQLISYQGRVVANGTNFHGSGQFKFTLVDGIGAQTFWSNDGSGSGGGEPATAVALNVNQGLVAVFLGDSTLPNMTPISSGVFATNSDVRLRIWAAVGSAGFALIRDGVYVGVSTLSAPAGGVIRAPCGSVNALDVPAPGQHTYTLAGFMITGGSGVVRHLRLLAYEL